MPLAVSLVDKALRKGAAASDGLDLERSLELMLLTPPGAPKQPVLKVPLVTGLLQQYNQVPLRFRPAEALLLAERLVGAGAPVNGGAREEGVTALDYAALLKAPRLLRALLQAGADVDSSAAAGAGTSLHHSLTARESVFMFKNDGFPVKIRRCYAHKMVML